MNQPSYIDVAGDGDHLTWRYLIGTGLIFFTWLVMGGMATAVLYLLFFFLNHASTEDMAKIAADPSLLGYIPSYLILNASFIFLFVGIWLVVRLVHHRHLRTVITARPNISWQRMWIGFGIWFLLGILASLVEYFIWPRTFSVNFDPAAFFPFVILALIFTPMQTTSEELFFRGYLVQAGSLIRRNPFFLAIWSGVLFALPHLLNPEVEADFVLVMLNYFLLGAFLAWISLKDGTIELAIGAHAANNLFAALVVTFPDSALKTPAIFYTTHFDPLFSLLTVIVSCALFYLVVFSWKRRAKPAVDNPLLEN